MKRNSLSRLTALALVLGFAPIAAVSAANPSAETELAPPSGATQDIEKRIATAQLVRDLAAYARAENDPEALLVAARILQESNIVLAAADGAPMVIGEAQGRDFPIVEPLTLLAEARAMADRDPAILEQIIEMIAAEDRGFLPQAIVYTHDLKAETRLVMQARAQGGRPAMVRVRGDGDARIEIVVRDEQGRQVCKDTPAAGQRGGDLVCRWTPRTTGNYRLELKNLGRVWTRTIMVSN